MNKIYIIFLIALLFINCKKAVNNSNQFAEFVHIGMTTRVVPIVYVSTNKIVLKLNDQQLIELKKKLGNSTPITEQTKEAYIKTRYDILVTNNKTVAAVRTFIFAHQEFFTDSEHLNNNPSKDSYDIVVNPSKVFSIYYEFKNQFFLELIAYLKQNKCDKHVIEEISYL
jgi:hypothetical protein